MHSDSQAEVKTARSTYVNPTIGIPGGYGVNAGQEEKKTKKTNLVWLRKDECYAFGTLLMV